MDKEIEDLDLWATHIKSAKKEHRPTLKNWERDGYGVAGSKKDLFERVRSTMIRETLERPSKQESLVSSNLISDDFSSCGTNTNGLAVPRIHASQLSVNEFRENFEKAGLPVVIGGIPYTEDWKCAKSDVWSFERLKENYGEVKMKCGEDDDGYAVKIRLKYFLTYLKVQKDDSPLYIFDSHFDDHNVAKCILDDYKVPSYFPDDLFGLVGEKRRPPYRWFLIGPKRSGTSCHIDPLGTSAWNTVIVGRKRWILFPPNTHKKVAKGKTVIREGEDDEAINFFLEHVPRLRKSALLDPSIQMFEFIQYPGDTVFVPGGWWHSVLNLDDTVAITQNFCSQINFEKVWLSARSGRKKMSMKWLRRLREHYPNLASAAETLNQRDSFAVLDNAKVNKNKHSKKRKKSKKKGKAKALKREKKSSAH